MLWSVTSTAFLQSLLNMKTPDTIDWIIAILFTVLIFLYEEARKYGIARSEKTNKQ